MLRASIPLVEDSPTKRNCPAGSIASAAGAAWVAKGEPDTGVNVPDEPSIANAETVLSLEFPVYRNFPLGSVARPCGPLPVVKGEPAICVSAPVVESVENADTVLFAFTVPDMPTYRNLPAPPIAMRLGPGKLVCVGKGEPVIGVNAPLVESIV